jgi:hypothetical protein
MTSSNPDDNEAWHKRDDERIDDIPKETPSQTPQKEQTKTFEDVPKYK